MRRLLLVWCACPALAVAQPAAPAKVAPDPVPDAKLLPGEAAAERLMTATRSDEQFTSSLPKVIDALLPALIQGNTGREADLRKIVSEEFGAMMLKGLPVFHAANRQLLAKHFSTAELDGLVTFYETPLGQKILTEMPAIQLELLQVGQGMGRAAMQAALPRIVQRMRAANMLVPQGV